MSKITIFITVVLLAIVASKSVEASPWTDTVMVVQQNIDKSINKAINVITGLVNKTKNKVDKMGESLKVVTEEFGQKVYNHIDRLLKKAEEKLQKVTADVDAGVNVTECKQLAKGLQVSGLAALSNMSSCIIEKLELGGGYIESISKLSSDVLVNLTVIKDEAHRCSANVDGPRTAAEAIVCSNVAGGKAAWVAAKSIPEVTVNVAKLTYHMATLPVSLPYCAASHGYIALRREYKGVVKRVKICVQQKINERNGNNEQPEQIVDDDEDTEDLDDENDSLEHETLTTLKYDFEPVTEQYDEATDATVQF